LIQAGAIKDTYPDDALRLLQMLLDEYPDRIFLASTYLTMAQCYIVQKQSERAIECFRKALQFAQREHSGFRYHAKLGLVTNPNRGTVQQLKRISELK
jgi:tetratricopeptide (TPR) repeat protein